MASSNQDTECDALKGVEFTVYRTENTSSNYPKETISQGSLPIIDVGDRFCQDFEDNPEGYQVLGQGSDGVVFKATKKLDKKTYAIKLIKRKFSKTNEQEVESLAQLNHPNIVRYYNAWIEKGNKENKLGLYIQLELCEITLSYWLSNNNTRNKETIEKYFLQLVTAVDYIHKEGFIHRDIKPSNIFLTANGDLKIGDFGLVTTHEYPENDQNRGTGSSTVDHSQLQGTQLYMSPEQLEKQAYDHKADIFSLGLVFLEMCVIERKNITKQIIFGNAREGNFPNQNIFPEKIFKILLNQMLNRNDKKRWSASQILQFKIFSKPKNKNIIVNIKEVGNINIGDGNILNVGNSHDT